MLKKKKDTIIRLINFTWEGF